MLKEDATFPRQAAKKCSIRTIADESTKWQLQDQGQNEEAHLGFRFLAAFRRGIDKQIQETYNGNTENSFQ